MKSLVWKEAKVMEVEEVNKPTLNENEVLVKVKAVGICGSEIEGYLGNNSLRIPPLIMGHEFSGEVAEVGSNVKNTTIGDRVVINPLLSCGKCSNCRRGLENLCDNRELIGVHRPGAFAEYVTVPEQAIWKIPKSIDYYSASLTEPLACSLRAVKRVIVKHPHANIIVFGAGAIGLLCSFVAQIMGSNNVIILDVQNDRLQTAKESGILHALHSNDPSLKEKIDAITKGRGIDAIIDAAGFISTRQLSFKLINNGGTIMNIGLGTNETPLPINIAIRQEISIEGSFSYTNQDFIEAMEMLISGKIRSKQWTEIRKLEHGSIAFQDLVNNRVAKGKIILSIE